MCGYCSVTGAVRESNTSTACVLRQTFPADKWTLLSGASDENIVFFGECSLQTKTTFVGLYPLNYRPSHLALFVIYVLDQKRRPMEQRLQSPGLWRKLRMP